MGEPATLATRNFVSRSSPRFGHNLEDHFDMAEFVCKMHSPTGEYLIWGLMFSTFGVTFGPLMHSNYYFTGRFRTKATRSFATTVGKFQRCSTKGTALRALAYELL